MWEAGKNWNSESSENSENSENSESSALAHLLPTILRESDFIYHFVAVTEANPGFERAFPLREEDYAGTITAGDVVIHSVCSGISAVGESYALPVADIVIYMVMAYEKSHNILTLKHFRK